MIQISNLRWRPKTSENILVSTTAGGCINFWDIEKSTIKIQIIDIKLIKKEISSEKSKKTTTIFMLWTTTQTEPILQLEASTKKYIKI